MKTYRITRTQAAIAVLALLLFSPWPLQAQNNAADKSAVLATVDGKNITEADISTSIAGQMMQLNNQIYTAKKRAVDALIADQLLDREAKKRGISREQLLQQEVNAKVEPVSDDEIQKAYDGIKARLGSKTLEEVKPQITQQLQAGKLQQRQQAFIQSLRKDATVKIALKPPVVNVPLDGAPVRGKEDAPVTLIEFSDFQCPFCARAHSTLNQVRETYKDQVKIVYKDFPLPIHPNAPKAAEASRCAREQGKYWEYHDVLFANSSALEVPNLKKFAADLKLDTAKFDECLDSGKYAPAIAKDVQEGNQAGVSGTPAFFINGRFLSGAQPFSSFQEVIDEVLAAK